MFSDAVTKNMDIDLPVWMTGSDTANEKCNKKLLGGDIKSEVFATTGATKKKIRQSVGATRSTYGGYESETDDDVSEEGCCGCSIDSILFGITSFHIGCLVLGIVGMATNIYCISRMKEEHSVNYQCLILRAYTTCFCIIIIAIEANWRTFTKHIKLLDLWIFRGLFYIYTGLQTMDEIKSVNMNEFSKTENIVGIALLMAGLLYTGLGACCIKSVTESKLRSSIYLGRIGDVENV